LFYKLCKETEISFRKHSIVTVRIIKVFKSNLVCRIMENGVIGYVYINDAINKNDKEMANVDDLT